MEGSLSRCVLRCERYVQKVVGSGLDLCPGCLGSGVLRTLQGGRVVLGVLGTSDDLGDRLLGGHSAALAESAAVGQEVRCATYSHRGYQRGGLLAGSGCD